MSARAARTLTAGGILAAAGGVAISFLPPTPLGWLAVGAIFGFGCGLVVGVGESTRGD